VRNTQDLVSIDSGLQSGVYVLPLFGQKRNDCQNGTDGT
jgi:hypothetical protein